METGESRSFHYSLSKVSILLLTENAEFLNYYNQLRTEVSQSSSQKRTSTFNMHVLTQIRIVHLA